jgi:multisubunit Na+/H+ antiporter MnhG subunit
MGVIKNFSLVVVSLIADLWFGIVRKPEFYDNHAVTRTKRGYVLFVTLAAIIAVGTALWLCFRIY